MDATEPNKTDGDGADQTPSLGQVLKAGRTARGLSLEQLSTELRIEVRQLQALEQDQFERIGPPVFVKGYVRHYAQRVGLDYGDLLSLYYKQAENRDVPVQPSRSISIRMRDERHVTVWIIVALVLVAVMVALAVWWLSSSTAAPAAVSPTPAAAPRPERPQPTADASRKAEPAPVAAAASSPAETPDSPAPTVQPPLARPEPRSAPAAPRSAPAGPPSAAALPLLELTLSFAEESWVEISDAHGQRLFYGLGRAGGNAALVGEPPILVLLGNAEGVQLTMNGADYPIPRGQGKLARFTLTAPD